MRKFVCYLTLKITDKVVSVGKWHSWPVWWSKGDASWGRTPLEGTTRNQTVYVRIAIGLKRHGVVRTANQCREMSKKLKITYKKANGNDGMTGKEQFGSFWTEFLGTDQLLRLLYWSTPPVQMASMSFMEVSFCPALPIQQSHRGLLKASYDRKLIGNGSCKIRLFKLHTTLNWVARAQLILVWQEKMFRWAWLEL